MANLKDPALLRRVRELADAKRQMEKVNNHLALAESNLSTLLAEDAILTSDSLAEQALQCIVEIERLTEKSYAQSDNYQELRDDLVSTVTS